MKKALLAAIVGVIAGAGFAVPHVASAAGAPPQYSGTCPSTVSPIVGPGTQAGVCVGGLPTSGAGVSGGALEAGVTTTNGPTRLCAAGTPVSTAANPVGVYVIADGDNANTANLAGYMGLSNYESGTSNEACPQPLTTYPAGGPNNGSGTNSGGNVGIDGVASVPVPLIVCGFTSGPNYNSNGRDGCYAP